MSNPAKAPVIGVIGKNIFELKRALYDAELRGNDLARFADKKPNGTNYLRITAETLERAKQTQSLWR